MQPKAFVAKWRNVNFGEKQASQEMFLDICALVEHPTPVDQGDRDAFTLERSAQSFGYRCCISLRIGIRSSCPSNGCGLI